MHVGFVLAQNMLAASTMLPLEMWRAAESTAFGRNKADATLLTTLFASQSEPVPTQSGISITPEANFDASAPMDVVYLPALWRNPRRVIKQNQPMLDWLVTQFESGAMLAAVGTGCCFLAEAGLLDGKSATTHWHYLERFARDYPKVMLKRDYFITQAGPLFCAASVNALADVTVHLIEHFYGRAIASHVERNFSHEIRRPYEKYRYLEGDDIQHTDELLIEIQLWMQRHLSQAMAVPEIARKFGLSPRSLSRRFKTATDRSPLIYLQEQRMRAAKDLLESTNLTIGEIAFRVGYHDQGHFARLFLRAMAVKPNDYRKTVRAKVFTTN
ncbi:MAG: transcriptional regulator GlxA family with amidase domain [Gammaproteobacteria bacterium]|jgi:transcriptional regulator GlxA family with amidase domain